MARSDSYVRARIDTHTKQRAAQALNAMGLSISDAIRLLMRRVATEHKLPFEVKVPSPTTRQAIEELANHQGKHFSNVDELMKDLHEND